MAEEKTDKAGTKRLTILEEEEIESIYGLPVFNEEERAFYSHSPQTTKPNPGVVPIPHL
jgi:hypothetical protein